MGGLFDLTNKTALVTGASGGLGQAIVERLAESGARVIASDLDGVSLSDLSRRWRELGLAVEPFAADMRREASISELASAVLRTHGGVDILVQNAGVQGPAGPIGEVSDADWDSVMDVNLRSALRLTRLLLPSMVARGSGSVILTSSIAGLRGNRAIGLYALSKAALSQLARNLAVEWGPSGIRVNAVAPGLIRTPLATDLLADASFMQKRLSMTPLRRVGEPDEVAGVVVMLASRAGGFITGQTIVIDGGTLISDGG